MLYLREKLTDDLFRKFNRLSHEEKLKQIYRNLDLDKLTSLKTAISNSDINTINEFIKSKETFLTLAEQISIYIYFYYFEENYKEELNQIMPKLLGEIEKHCSKIEISREANSEKLLKIELIKFLKAMIECGIDYIGAPEINHIISSNDFKISNEILKLAEVIDLKVQLFDSICNYITISERNTEKYLQDLESLTKNHLFSLFQQYHILKLFLKSTKDRMEELNFLKKNIFTFIKEEYLITLEQCYADKTNYPIPLQQCDADKTNYLIILKQYYADKNKHLITLINTYIEQEFKIPFRLIKKPKIFMVTKAIDQKNDFLLNLFKTELNYYDQMLLFYYCYSIPIKYNYRDDIIPLLHLLPKNELEHIEKAITEQDLKLRDLLLVNFIRKEIANNRFNLIEFKKLASIEKITISENIYQHCLCNEHDYAYPKLISEIDKLYYHRESEYNDIALIPDKYLALIAQQKDRRLILDAIKNAYLNNNLDKLDFLFDKDNHVPVIYELKTDGIYLSDDILIGFGIMQILDFVGPYIPTKYFPSFSLSKPIILAEIYTATAFFQFKLFPNNLQDIAGLYLSTHSAIFSTRIFTLELFNKYNNPPTNLDEIPEYCMHRSGMVSLPSLVGLGFLSFYSAKDNPLAKFIPMTINHLVNMGVATTYCYNNYKMVMSDSKKYLVDDLIVATIDLLAFIEINKNSDLAFNSLGRSVYSASTIIANGVIVYSLLNPIAKLLLEYVPEDVKEYGDSLLSGINSGFLEIFSSGHD